MAASHLANKERRPVDEEEAQAIASVAGFASVAPPTRFTSGLNDHEAGPSTSGVVHMADSGKEE